MRSRCAVLRSMIDHGSRSNVPGVSVLGLPQHIHDSVSPTVSFFARRTREINTRAFRVSHADPDAFARSQGRRALHSVCQLCCVGGTKLKSIQATAGAGLAPVRISSEKVVRHYRGACWTLIDGSLSVRCCLTSRPPVGKLL